ncbi:MAG: 16S rRNA (guanine(966)-N(2))-methyltransferase RsmD [Deltaproteobacteria bacterium CG11_big_fil_rev_8_21_14_0_20_49_13]|nr:MAG: 16S rRNA (guanine(966)-N(2))-methyltransferase RsmD [Deltaproteobacteria bacterium CG11_big_fil_rev_8_21_14_0_20_49_13]
MRVIAGTAKGRKLYTPKSNSIRPALDKIKGAVFNILFNVEGLKVLDLFAGTGAVAIEALSRGAVHATFVDMSHEAITIIGKNIERCRFAEKAKVFPRPVSVAVEYFGRHQERFDLIFVDPPYLKNMVNSTLAKIAEANILAEGGRIVVEHHPKEPIREVAGLALTDTRKYGQTSVSFLCPAK